VAALAELHICQPAHAATPGTCHHAPPTQPLKPACDRCEQASIPGRWFLFKVWIGAAFTCSEPQARLTCAEQRALSATPASSNLRQHGHAVLGRLMIWLPDTPVELHNNAATKMQCPFPCVDLALAVARSPLALVSATLVERPHDSHSCAHPPSNSGAGAQRVRVRSWRTQMDRSQEWWTAVEVACRQQHVPEVMAMCVDTECTLNASSGVVLAQMQAAPPARILPCRQPLRSSKRACSCGADDS
jgi:hypothetical protein